MKGKPFLIVFFAVVGLVGLLSIYLSNVIERADRTVESRVSPDKRFKAVMVTFAMPEEAFCFETVSVMLAVYPDEFAQKNKEYQMFAAPCARFADGSQSPKIEWLSDKALRITHVKPPAGAKDPHLRHIDVTKTVRVFFVERE